MTLDMTKYYLDFKDTFHNISRAPYGTTHDDLLDALELSSEAYYFKSLNNGSIQTYFVVLLNGVRHGLGFVVRGDTIYVTTVLAPHMIASNDRNAKGDIYQINVKG